MTKRRPLDPFVCALLGAHPHDPENARYLVPLENPEDEAEAQDMACVNYHAYADSFADGITEEQADRVWEQCLIDARKMICDPKYLNMIMRL